MRTLLVAVCSFFFFRSASAQPVDTINPDGLKALVTMMASDSLGGRGNYQKGARLAADFISNEFKSYGLQTFPSYNSYYHPFFFNEKKIVSVDSSSVTQNTLQNVIGVLEGKTKPAEIVIICAHYDHLGITESKQKDTIYNGANDNASGTAAMLTLAHYFSLRDDNSRTLIFCAFAGEELGLLGSLFFSHFLKPESVVAVLNLEMLGIAQWGKNRFFLTGAGYGNMVKHIDACLKGTSVKRIREPNDEKNLFARSDNFPFAEKGIPAHTFMSSDDDDACYHKVCDEVKRFDFNHLAEVVKHIALVALPIVQGQVTPKRIRPAVRNK